MRRSVPFLVLLLLAFMGLVALADSAIARITMRWEDEDLTRRARLAVVAARPMLQYAWYTSGDMLDSVLQGITRDERVIAVATCTNGKRVAASTLFPREVDCGTAEARRDKGPCWWNPDPLA